MKINDKSQTYIVIAIIIFAFYYLIIKPAKKGFTDSLGITDSQDKIDVENEVQNTNSPLNAQLWHTYFYQPPATPNGRQKLSGVFQLAAPKMIKDLKKCFGILTDNEAGVYTFFSRFKTQSEVSYFSQVFKEVYNKDLFTFLKTGLDLLPENGLSYSAVNKIVKTVKKLKFK